MDNLGLTSVMAHPIQFIKQLAGERRLQDLRERSISQEEYFANQVEYINSTYDHMNFFGYDKPFMEREGTIQALRHAVVHREGRIPVSAILPTGLNTILDELAKESELVTIVRTPETFTKGYIIFDNWGMSTWDSTKKTYYPPEENKGVIFRAMMLDLFYDSTFIDFCEKKFQKAKVGLQTK